MIDAAVCQLCVATYSFSKLLNASDLRKRQTPYRGCFSRQSVCSVVSINVSMSRTIHSQESVKTDVKHCYICKSPHRFLQLTSSGYFSPGMCETEGACVWLVPCRGKPEERGNVSLNEELDFSVSLSFRSLSARSSEGFSQVGLTDVRGYTVVIKRYSRRILIR